MDNIDLCFCIPTYNRSQSINRLVTDILSCEDKNIHVVVLDNGSTDDTLSILQKIKDSRLSVYSNGKNFGALYNMVNVLNKGIGKFLVYSTDQDYVDKDKITAFKTFLLQSSNLACGYCTFNSNSITEYDIFSKGYQALKNIAYKGRHPTGYFFNYKYFKSIKIVERFSDFEFVDLFPLEFVFAELCLMGDGAIYNKPIFTPETGENVVNHKSSTTNGKSNKAFFSPEARLKLAINYTKHLNTLDVSVRVKDLIVTEIFVRELIAATKGYKSVLKNKNLCIHYRMESRVIKNRELLNIGIEFYKQYVKNTCGNDFGELKKFRYILLLKFFSEIRRLLSKFLNRVFKFT